MLGMIRDGEGVGIKLLKNLKINTQDLRKLIEQTLPVSIRKVNNLANIPLVKQAEKTYDISETVLDRPITAGLSGGEKKLGEALQRAVLKPQFAILDEIDSGVDVDALKKVFAVVDALKKEGTGFLIISHNPSLLSHLVPDQVHVMAGGKLMKSGGKDLAESVLRDGFCKTIECPLEEHCEAKN